ncbi:EutP/PduV family microcompartment system protein [Brevibacillus laterosporus]
MGKIMMLVGRTGCGKTTLTQALMNTELSYRKTQMIETVENIIDTPGEYIENRNYYRALIVTSAECDLIDSYKLARIKLVCSQFNLLVPLQNR